MKSSAKINKIKLIALTIIILFTFTSCGEKIVRNESDEVQHYTWKYACSESINSYLTFDNNTASLTIESFGEECIIKGMCAFSDNRFIIVDEATKKPYFFSFRLTGDKLILAYDGDEIEFDKEI